MKDNKRIVNKMLTWGGGLYLFYNGLDSNNILINLKQTMERTNRNIRCFS